MILGVRRTFFLGHEVVTCEPNFHKLSRVNDVYLCSAIDI